MRHRIGFNRLGRRPAHRKALKRNMVTSLLLEERITTTQTKAGEVRRMAEKMVTRAKEDTVHNRRMVGREIKNKKALARLFTEIGPRFKSRAGGYTRVLKLGPRVGDAAEMVLLEFVDRGDAEVEQPKKKKKKADADKNESTTAGQTASKTRSPRSEGQKAQDDAPTGGDVTADAAATEKSGSRKKRKQEAADKTESGEPSAGEESVTAAADGE
ncbi:MAG: 50S ribosomal protein L17 [Spirochaetaceae bacterium]|nr:MAG: 50S ribosomal protein L17 [Spirochaetaceae bacterium]